MDWKTIDSAPRDGIEFDAWTPKYGGYRLVNVRWVACRGREGWQHIRDDGFDNQDWCDVKEELTHWMPLPEPPK